MNRFGSWFYHGAEMDMYEKVSGNAADASEYEENCSYKISNSYSQRNVHYYTCCPGDPYVDITVTVHYVPKETK